MVPIQNPPQYGIPHLGWINEIRTMLITNHWYFRPDNRNTNTGVLVRIVPCGILRRQFKRTHFVRVESKALAEKIATTPQAWAAAEVDEPEVFNHNPYL